MIEVLDRSPVDVRAPGVTPLASPPTDNELFVYYGPQRRWLWHLHLLAFVGTAVSLYGFSRMSYWTVAFGIVLVILAMESIIGSFTSTHKRRHSLAEHLLMVDSYWAETQMPPSVDIFIPTCGEGAEVMANTMRWTSKVTYPGVLNVYILDDAADVEVQAYAEAYGFHYIARPGSKFKKAGNLQYAFERTTGEHILILDADFVPRADVLMHTIPHMEADPRIGILQTPQFYPTRTEGMNWIERNAGATQEPFYHYIQPSRDAVEATICCGTSAVYRRSALEATDGFPAIGHSEDMFTGFDQSEHDYRVGYLPVNVTKGLCPTDISSFITQQYRWCNGSIVLARMRRFWMHETMKWKAKLCFISGFFYYGTTAMNGLFAPVPLIIMVWFFPGYVKASNMVPLLGLLVLWFAVYPLTMHTKWRIETLRVQVIYSFAHLAAIFDTFWGKEAEWVPTGGQARPTPLAVRVMRMIVVYLGLTLTAGLVGAVYQAFQPGFEWQNWWALWAFAALNLYVFAPVIFKSGQSLVADVVARRNEAVAVSA